MDALLHCLKERYRDAPNHQRRIYKLWEEGRAPDVVFELTSERTYREDLSDKRLIYEELGG